MNKVQYFAENQFVLQENTQSADNNDINEMSSYDRQPKNLMTYTNDSILTPTTPATQNVQDQSHLKSNVLLDELNDLQDQLNSNSPYEPVAMKEK